MKVNNSLFSAALALLLTACTPSLNLQVDLPELTGPGFSVALEASTVTGPAPLAVEFSADVRESGTYAWYVNDRKLAREKRLLTIPSGRRAATR